MTKPSAPHQPILLLPIKQKSDSHCGPATLQLLYSHLNLAISQTKIVRAAGIGKRIRKMGSRPTELAAAVSVLTPELKFVFKQKATKEDLYQMVCVNRWPVAVNWQGLFYDKPEEEQIAELDKLPGYKGHYSVVIDLDLEKDEIVIVDPYPEFADRPRRFDLTWFMSRWWDRVEDKDPISKELSFTSTNRFMFVVAPAEKLPARLKFQPAEKLAELTF